MSFWAYMLHCHGGSFYVGQTDDLERRVAQHKTGAIAGFTADHLPVELVWSQEFPTRDEAKAAERRVKGWSRAKKLALIRGDWARISDLAKKQDSASTSSAWTGEGESKGRKTSRADKAPAPKPVCPELVEGSSFYLIPHPSAPPHEIRAISARILRLDGDWLTLRWKVDGAAALVMPPFAGRARTDGLWQNTCFELFVKAPGADAYAEFNLSPSERWAAYDFTGYRAGMAERPVERAPVCTPRRGQSVLVFDAAIPASALPPLPWAYGLTAVIEEEGGHKSFWAMTHGRDVPDFHDPACFAGRLAAPQAP